MKTKLEIMLMAIMLIFMLAGADALPLKTDPISLKTSEPDSKGAQARPWVCGVWIHPGFFGPDKGSAVAKIQTTLDEYARAGINTLIVLVKNTSGHVYYASELGVRDGAWNWDFFEVFLDEARKRRMEVHPWFCVFPETSLLGQVRQHPEWLIMGPKREMVSTVNPALPEVRAYEISLMTELVKKYGVNWVHLDYIRYPCEPTEPYFSHDPDTVKLFKQETGVDFSTLKARDSGNPYWNVWLEWNRDQVTRFVQELREALKATGLQVKISAAVFPDADNARVLIGQDWASWGQRRLVDMLCPMLYTNDTTLFENLTKKAVSYVTYSPGQPLVCAGIGLGTSHNQSTPEIMMEEIRIARSAGASGVIFFSSSSLTAPFLEKLSQTKKGDTLHIPQFFFYVLPDQFY